MARLSNLEHTTRKAVFRAFLGLGMAAVLTIAPLPDASANTPTRVDYRKQCKEEGGKWSRPESGRRTCAFENGYIEYDFKKNTETACPYHWNGECLDKGRMPQKQPPQKKPRRE